VKSSFHYDPLPVLLAEADPALTWFVRRELLDIPAGPVDALWELPEAVRLVHKQQANGSWRYPGKSNHPASNSNYDLLETYRSLRILVEMYGFTRDHPALTRAADYVFSCQSNKGDIRGISGNQFMPYYHGAILELLIKAGYAKDARLQNGLRWLLSMRQKDGGWIIPVQGLPASQKVRQLWEAAPVPPDRSLPHAHLATGMILRAFAAHPEYRRVPEVISAGERLKERFFLSDRYYDRKAPSYWLKFQFPFWWPNLLTALDTLFWLGFDRRDDDIARGLAWFVENQAEDGLWETGYGSGKGAKRMRSWVGLAICRVFRNFFFREAGGSL
jgi:hypothetical protein